jgi:hypothetical protein
VRCFGLTALWTAALGASAGCGEDPGLLPAPDAPLETVGALDFGPVLIGSQRTFTIPVRNPNATPVRIESAEFEGEDAAEFSLPDDLPTIPERGELDLGVTFEPTRPERGERAAQLLLDVGPFFTTVDLTAFAIDVTLAVRPESVDFGNMAPGSTRTTVLDVTNTTENAATFRGQAPEDSPFRFVSGTLTLDGFESGSMLVEFAAPVAGTGNVRAEMLRIGTVGLAADEVLVPARAEVPSPAIECPGVVEVELFAATAVGSETFRCVNLTDQALAIGLIDVTSDPDRRWDVDFFERFDVAPRAGFDVLIGFDAQTDRFAEEDRATVRLFPRNPERPGLTLEPARVDVFTTGN